jgi:hypothetical protein
MVFTFVIHIDDLKREINRQRLHETTIEQCLNFFEQYGIHAEYNQGLQSITIVINLGRCVLTPAQARNLSTAMEYFRAENT